MRQKSGGNFPISKSSPPHSDSAVFPLSQYCDLEVSPLLAGDPPSDDVSAESEAAYR